MTDEVKLAGERERGFAAQQLMENSVYRDAVTKIREGIHAKWAASPIRDVEGQTQLRIMLKLLDELEANIKSVALTGKMAAQQIEHARTLKEKAKGFVDSLIGK